MKVAYHGAIREDVGELRAVGKLLSLTRRTVFTEAQLLDSKGKLYASATSTLYITEKRKSLTDAA